MGIFAKFSQPKTWYQEEKLRSLYLNVRFNFSMALNSMELEQYFLSFSCYATMMHRSRKLPSIVFTLTITPSLALTSKQVPRSFGKEK